MRTIADYPFDLVYWPEGAIIEQISRRHGTQSNISHLKIIPLITLRYDYVSDSGLLDLYMSRMMIPSPSSYA
jgi:hypothetical protein